MMKRGDRIFLSFFNLREALAQPGCPVCSLAERNSLFSVSRIIARKLKKALNPDFVCMYARGDESPIPISF